MMEDLGAFSVLKKAKFLVGPIGTSQMKIV